MKRDNLGRRAFVAAAAALPFIAARAQTTDYDVIVVGAGVAGIAACRALQTAGHRVIMLEARDRIGGRTLTDTATLGVPFDLGALWFHSAEKNPLCALARARGIALESSDFDDIELRRAGARVGVDFSGELSRGESQIMRSAFWNVLFGIDRSLASVAGTPEAKLVAQSEALQCAAPEEELSLLDIAALDGGANLIPDSGMGAFVAGLGRDLPVRLNCPVAGIDYSGSTLRVSGAFGAVAAKACVVTLPTGLMASEAIAFTPALPGDVKDAFDALPMGLMLKIGVVLREPLPDSTEFSAVATDRVAAVRLDKMQRLVTIITGGRYAREVSAGGLRGKEAFARDVLREAFGAAVVQPNSPMIATAWDEEPYSRGAYAHATVGHHRARKVYDRHVAERVFFAGEAGGREYSMTVGGAWGSGLRAAAMCSKAILGRHG